MLHPATARRAALFFGLTHSVVCVAGLVEPRAYGLTLGRDTARARLRVLAALDAPFALAVSDAALTGAPLAARLRVGAASDVGRAVAMATLFPGSPPVGRALLIAASLAGAATAWTLSGVVDLEVSAAA